MKRILSTTAIAGLLMTGAGWAQDSSDSQAQTDSAAQDSSQEMSQDSGSMSSDSGSMSADTGSDMGGMSGETFAEVPAGSDLLLSSNLVGASVYTMSSEGDMAGAGSDMASESGDEAATEETGGMGEGESTGTSTGDTASAAPQGDNIGQINELIMTQDGQVDYAIVGVGGFLGIGERSVAVNYDALQITMDESGSMQVMVDATQDEIENAPEFDRDAFTGQGEAASGESGMGEGSGDMGSGEGAGEGEGSSTAN